MLFYVYAMNMYIGRKLKCRCVTHVHACSVLEYSLLRFLLLFSIAVCCTSYNIHVCNVTSRVMLHAMSCVMDAMSLVDMSCRCVVMLEYVTCDVVVIGCWMYGCSCHIIM